MHCLAFAKQWHTPVRTASLKPLFVSQRFPAQHAVAYPDVEKLPQMGMIQRVETLIESPVSGVCPNNESISADASLPSTGSARALVPSVSSVLSRHCDFLPALPPHFVSFAWRYHGNTPLSLPPPRRVADGGPGVVHPVSPSGDSSVETTGISQVPGEPQFPFAHGLRGCLESLPSPARGRGAGDEGVWKNVALCQLRPPSPGRCAATLSR
jgi:hypothetical protein